MRGFRGNSEAHREAGRLGGLKTKEKYGIKHYAKLGKIGGKLSSGRFSKEDDRASKASKARKKKHEAVSL